MDKKYSVTTFWLVCVQQKSKGTITWVNRWKRISKDYFKTKKQALSYASLNTMYYVKTTFRKEVK